MRVRLHALSDCRPACSLCNFCDCRLPSIHLRSSLDPCKLQWADGPGLAYSELASAGERFFCLQATVPCWVGCELPELSHRDSGGPRTGNSCRWLVDTLILQRCSGQAAPYLFKQLLSTYQRGSACDGK